MNYYIRKIAGFLFTLFLISIITFSVFQILPGDPALVMLGVDADPVQIENFHKSLDLDRPAMLRYISWITKALHGNLGMSFRYHRPVISVTGPAFVVTAQLAFFVLLLTIVTGIPAGIWLALHDKSPVSVPASLIAQMGIYVPVFCAAIFFILIFSVKFHLFPSMGYISWSENPAACIRSLFLPAVSLSFGTTGVLVRYMRSGIVGQLGLDYVRTARSKGLGMSKIITSHVLRNALIPVVTIFGMLTAEILGGSIIIENIFSLPGLGKLLAGSILSRDFPLIQGIVLYTACIVVACNFFIDVLYSIIDPRIRK
jgi:peptide/nickel transport system permease protein